jgi:hypothetical protein
MTNNELKELLVITMEECAEVQLAASKLYRFGSDTAERVHELEVEVGDLMCMIELLDDYNLINMDAVRGHKYFKREKLKKWSDLTKL